MTTEALIAFAVPFAAGLLVVAAVSLHRIANALSDIALEMQRERWRKEPSVIEPKRHWLYGTKI